jgi:hypothetical protein
VKEKRIHPDYLVGVVFVVDCYHYKSNCSCLSKLSILTLVAVPNKLQIVFSKFDDFAKIKGIAFGVVALKVTLTL